MKNGKEIKKGSSVKFAIKHANGTLRGIGTVTALPPKGATRGACRLTVKDTKTGAVRKIFAIQCTAV